MKNRIVTISREFGSGGRTIGKKLAKELNIPCYDRDLLLKIAEKSGFHEDYIKDAGEYAPGGRIASALAYRSYTDMKWGEAQNYDITLNSGTLGIDRCVDIIKQLY